MAVTERREGCGSICKTFYLQNMLRTGRGQTKANWYDTGKTDSIPGTGKGQQMENVIQWARQEGNPDNQARVQAWGKQCPNRARREG